jgi:glycosyl transferase family 2
VTTPSPPGDGAAPLVSIGIPTYNRADRLRRAVASALGQTHARLEIVISDNGSTDGTPEVCREIAAADPRVRVLRHPENRGPIANFNAVIDALGGEFAMLLADDDWLDPDYVERCLAELAARPDHALVGGLAQYHDASGPAHTGQEWTMEEGDRVTRVRRYLRRVDDNGVFYGLMRGDDLRRAAPMHDVLGSDWLLVAAVAFAGKVLTIETTHVNRSLGGASRSIPNILTTMRGAGPFARAPWVPTVAALFADAAWRSPAYAPAGPLGRVLVALRIAPAPMRWLGTLWLIGGPTALAVARRSRGGFLRGAVDRLVERGGDPRLARRARG